MRIPKISFVSQLVLCSAIVTVLMLANQVMQFLANWRHAWERIARVAFGLSILIAILSPYSFAQTSTKVAPDCPLILASRTTTGVSGIYDNRPQSASTSPCTEFIFTASATTANMSFTVSVESAQDNGVANCAGCSWSTFASLTLTAEGAKAATKAYGDYLRINLTAINAGTVSAQLSGWRPNQATASAGSPGPPTGPAGGDLSGTYPNPTVAKVNGNTPGGTCTNQFTRSIDTSARPACATVTSADVDGSIQTVSPQAPFTVLAGPSFGTTTANPSFRPLTAGDLPLIPSAGYQPNQALGGCGVQYVSGLTFTVGACTYTLAGETFNTPITNVTLSAADPTNDRIDVIAVDVTSTVIIVTGTPTNPPAAPALDPATQLGLTFAYVAATATTPSNITTTTIYDENTEWACTSSGTINCNSTNNPYHLTKDIEASAAARNDVITLVKPASGTVDLSNSNTLIFYLRSKAAWPTGNGGANAARYLNVFWLNGLSQKGNTVVVKTGQFGFNSSSTAAYQQIAIPTNLFGINGVPVTTLKIQVSGKGGTATIGFYLDWIELINGVAPAPLPTSSPTKRTTCFVIGANNAAAPLVDADLGPQSRQFFINTAQTILEIEVAADDGTPNIIVGRSRAGTIVNLTSVALSTAASGGIACANTTGALALDGVTTCSATLQNTILNAGDWLTLVSGTAGGTAKELTACVTTGVQ